MNFRRNYPCTCRYVLSTNIGKCAKSYPKAEPFFQYILILIYVKHSIVSNTLPQMNFCFEILDEIFQYVYHDSSRTKGTARDMLALAQTCRTFADVALNILWHTQDNFVHLIKVLPQRCWFAKGEDKFDGDFVSTSATCDVF